MIKSNSKKAVENIRAYVMNSTQDYFMYDYNKTPEEVASFDQVAKLIYDKFINEYVKNDCRYNAGRVSKQDLFLEYAGGLPCGSLFDYYLSTAVDTLGAILEETETEKARFDQDRAEKMLTKLIYREVVKFA